MNETKNKFIAILKYFLFIVLGIALLYFAFKDMDFNKMKSELLNANYYWILLSLVMGLVAYVSRAYRWNLLLEPLGYKPKITNSISAVSIAYFANLALPRFGEVARCTTLYRTDKIPFNTLLGTVIAERAFDFICLIFCLIITFFLNFDVFSSFFLKVVLLPLTLKFSGFLNNLLFNSFILFIFATITYFVVINIKKIIPNKLKELFIGILEGIKSINKVQNKWAFLFHTVLIWIMYFGMIYVCFFAVEFTSHFGISEAFFLLIAGGLAMVAPVQGGIGAYHFMIATALTFYGLTFENGLIFATLVHTTQLLMILFTGVLTLLYLFLTGTKLKDGHN